MPRYTFAYSDLPPDADPITAVLVDAEAARGAAITAMGEIMRDIGPRFWRSPDWALVVTNEAGVVVGRVQVLGTTDSK